MSGACSWALLEVEFVSEKKKNDEQQIGGPTPPDASLLKRSSRKRMHQPGSPASAAGPGIGYRGFILDSGLARDVSEVTGSRYSWFRYLGITFGVAMV